MPDDSSNSCHRAAQHELASLRWVFSPGGIHRSRPLTLTRSPRRVLAAARGACLLLLAAAAVVLAEGEGVEEKRGVRLLDAGRLEKFADGLPDMSVLHGYGVADSGRLVPGELTVGMYDTTWDDYAAEDDEYEEKLKKETFALYFLATTMHLLFSTRETKSK